MGLPRFYKHRVLVSCVLCAVFLCLTLISLVDRWTPEQLPGKRPKRVNDLTQLATQAVADPVKQWEAEYANRVQRVRDTCEKDEIASMRKVWRVAANRRFGKKAYCKSRMCPVIVDEQKVLFFCFVPKVASTLVKHFFLNITGVALNETVLHNNTALHLVANNVLKRVSPMYYPSTTVNRFFKIIFVRHPFDRLVSVFRTQSLWDRLRDLYGKYCHRKRSNSIEETAGEITFPDFVRYLTETPLRDFDEHWIPYWSRCDPCLVDYDFIGKLETAEHDFPYAFSKVGIDSNPEWWVDVERTPHSMTLQYFSTVPEADIRRLYEIYKLDFQLFGYSIDQFLPGRK